MSEFCKPCEIPAPKHNDDHSSDEEVRPVDRIVLPKDVVEINDEDESVFIIGTRDEKVTRLQGLENMLNLKVIFSY